MKIDKKIMIILVICIFLLIITTQTFAATITASDVKNNESLGNAGTEIKTIGEKIFSGIYSVGSAVSVITIAFLGVKYMMGSAEQKADYKKSMLPYLIGAICLFGATSIANMIYTVAIQI